MIERPLYLSRLKAWQDKDMIKVITGIRRCGKSSLLINFAENLKKDGVLDSCIIQMNFEDLKYDGMDYKTLHDILLAQVEQNKENKTYIFLDEIQKVPEWEKMAASLRLNPNVDLYLTGSNAYMLSSELATFLSGRYIEIKMLPLSFKEFLSFYNFSSDTSLEKKFGFYMRYGGMPSLKDYNFNERQTLDTLDGIYNTVLIKDVITRSTNKDVNVIKKILHFLADNIGNLSSINSITNTLYTNKGITSKNNSLVESYISLLENAFIFYNIGRYDIKGKDYLKSLNKYYIVDSGLRSFLLNRVIDTGRIIENIVYFELLRRGYNVSIGKVGDKEVDFIATNNDEKIYYQVCENISSEETKSRELSSLRDIEDSYPKFVLTMDTLTTQTTEDGIKITNIIDWLLAE
ncbi:MAG: ATP-binding protein [Alphaproteobacteria bacterium]